MRFLDSVSTFNSVPQLDSVPIFGSVSTLDSGPPLSMTGSESTGNGGDKGNEDNDLGNFPVGTSRYF